MKHTTTTATWWQVGACAAIVLLLAPVATAGDTNGGPQSEAEIFRGLVISMGNIGTGRNTSLNMHITDWTSPTQRQVLMNALMEGSSGDENLFNVMRTQPEKGFLQVRNEPGTIRLKYAWQKVADDGARSITLIADNLLPIFITQGTQRLKELQYTIVDLEFDAEGKGSGSMANAASIGWDAEAQRIKIGIESTEPLRITCLVNLPGGVMLDFVFRRFPVFNSQSEYPLISKLGRKVF